MNPALHRIFQEINKRLVYFFINDQKDEVDVWFDGDNSQLIYQDIKVSDIKFIDDNFPSDIGDDYYNRKIVISLGKLKKSYNAYKRQVEKENKNESKIYSNI